MLRVGTLVLWAQGNGLEASLGLSLILFSPSYLTLSISTLHFLKLLRALGLVKPLIVSTP